MKRLLICFRFFCFALFLCATTRAYPQPRFSYIDVKEKNLDKDLYYLTDKGELNISIDHDILDAICKVQY